MWLNDIYNLVAMVIKPDMVTNKLEMHIASYHYYGFNHLGDAIALPIGMNA